MPGPHNNKDPLSQQMGAVHTLRATTQKQPSKGAVVADNGQDLEGEFTESYNVKDINS